MPLWQNMCAWRAPLWYRAVCQLHTLLADLASAFTAACLRTNPLMHTPCPHTVRLYAGTVYLLENCNGLLQFFVFSTHNAAQTTQ